MSGGKENGHAVNGLTARQQEIMTLVLRGMSNKEIARALHISDGVLVRPRAARERSGDDRGPTAEGG